MCILKEIFNFIISVIYHHDICSFFSYPILAAGTRKPANKDLPSVVWKTIELVHYTHGISTACVFLASMVCYNFVAHNKRSDALSIGVCMR